MFGKNEIIGKSYFNQAADDQLFVTSIFYTLQGEGPYRGEPAIFVRLAKCNLACSFCDTYFDGGDWLTFDDVYDRIMEAAVKYFGGEVPGWFDQKVGLVITGGEPMLQKNLGIFLEKVKNLFAWTQIESNGTVWQDIPAETTLVCSPKCLEKDGKPVKYLKPNTDVMDRADCLKFVMNADADSPYSDIPDWAQEYASAGKKVFVSPMNVYNREPKNSKQMRSTKNDITMEERSMVDEKISFWEDGLLNMQSNQANHEYTASYCVKHGFTFNMQLHLFASMA
jgi:organic radical activating enzyme